MGLEATLFCILFSMIVFVLGLLFKLIADFRKEIFKKMHKTQEMFLEHIHAEDGTAYVPRKQAAN